MTFNMVLMPAAVVIVSCCLVLYQFSQVEVDGVREIIKFVDVLCVQVAASSEFQIRLRSYHNDEHRAADGYCCTGAPNGDDVTGRCAGSCRTFFRICLSHYTADIVPNQSCTFGVLVTHVLGDDSIDFEHVDDAAASAADANSTTLLTVARDFDNSSTKPLLNPVRMPIRITWPVSQCLALQPVTLRL